MREAAARLRRMHLLRLQPGEELITELREQMVRSEAPAATLCGAVGSLRRLVYCVAQRAPAGVRFGPQRTVRGAMELTALQGQLGREGDGGPAVHVHGLVAAEDGTILGGHVLAAEVLITVEVTLLFLQGAGWVRGRQAQGGRAPELPVLQPSDLDFGTTKYEDGTT